MNIRLFSSKVSFECACGHIQRTKHCSIIIVTQENVHSMQKGVRNRVKDKIDCSLLSLSASSTFQTPTTHSTCIKKIERRQRARLRQLSSIMLLIVCLHCYGSKVISAELSKQRRRSVNKRSLLSFKTLSSFPFLRLRLTVQVDNHIIMPRLN